MKRKSGKVYPLEVAAGEVRTAYVARIDEAMRALFAARKAMSELLEVIDEEESKLGYAFLYQIKRQIGDAADDFMGTDFWFPRHSESATVFEREASMQ